MRIFFAMSLKRFSGKTQRCNPLKDNAGASSTFTSGRFQVPDKHDVPRSGSAIIRNVRKAWRMPAIVDASTSSRSAVTSTRYPSDGIDAMQSLDVMQAVIPQYFASNLTTSACASFGPLIRMAQPLVRLKRPSPCSSNECGSGIICSRSMRVN